MSLPGHIHKAALLSYLVKQKKLCIGSKFMN